MVNIDIGKYQNHMIFVDLKRIRSIFVILSKRPKIVCIKIFINQILILNYAIIF